MTVYHYTRDEDVFESFDRRELQFQYVCLLMGNFLCHASCWLHVGDARLATVRLATVTFPRVTVDIFIVIGYVEVARLPARAIPGCTDYALVNWRNKKSYRRVFGGQKR